MLKDEAGSQANGYFVYLPDIKVTLNLTQIAFVEWNTVSDPKIDPAFITTVTLAGGGGFYLTKADTEILWKALQVFNQRQVQSGIALNRIYDLLFWVNNPVDTLETEPVSVDTTTNTTSSVTTSPNNSHSSATSGVFYKDSRIRSQERERESEHGSKKREREYSPVTN